MVPRHRVRPEYAGTGNRQAEPLVCGLRGGSPHHRAPISHRPAEIPAAPGPVPQAADPGDAEAHLVADVLAGCHTEPSLRWSGLPMFPGRRFEQAGNAAGRNPRDHWGNLPLSPMAVPLLLKPRNPQTTPEVALGNCSPPSAPDPGKWQGSFGAIWPGGLIATRAGAGAEHLHDPMTASDRRRRARRMLSGCGVQVVTVRYPGHFPE